MNVKTLHLALNCYSLFLYSPDSYVDTNSAGPKFTSGCKECKVGQFIHTSTSDIWDSTFVPITEDIPCRTISIFCYKEGADT